MSTELPRHVPVVSQAPAGPPATPHGLIDATHVVTLWGSTRCTGCNAVDEYWCSCPDGYTPDGPDPAGPLVDVEELDATDLAGLAAREDSAHPTTQDGDTPTRPTPEEER